MKGRGRLHSQPPGKTRGLSWQWAALVDAISFALSQLTAGGMRCVPCDSAVRGLSGAGAWCSPDCSPCGFAFCCFCFLSLHGINASHYYNDKLSAVSSSKPLNPGLVLGTWTWRLEGELGNMKWKSGKNWFGKAGERRILRKLEWLIFKCCWATLKLQPTLKVV